MEIVVPSSRLKTGMSGTFIRTIFIPKEGVVGFPEVLWQRDDVNEDKRSWTLDSRPCELHQLWEQ